MARNTAFILLSALWSLNHFCGIWALHQWALPITLVAASCHSWCSHMPSKLSNLFLSNMPWFLYTSTSLLIPVTLLRTPSLFASGKFFFVPCSTQRSPTSFVDSWCSDQEEAFLMPPSLPLHCVRSLCSHPFPLWLLVSTFITFSWLRVSQGQGECVMLSQSLDPQCLSVVLSTLNICSVKWFEWMLPGSDCGRNE